MTETKQRLTDIQNDFKKGSSCIPNNEIQKVNELVRNFGNEETKFKNNLQNIVKDIRSAKKDVSELSKLTKEFLNSKLSPNNLNEEIQSLELSQNKINQVQKLENSGIKYFGKSKIIDLNNEVYIYYAEDLLRKNDISSFFAKLQKTLRKETPDTLFCIADLSVRHFSEGQKDVLRNKIVHYKGGKKYRPDVMAHMGGKVSLCQIKFNGGDQCSQIPNNRAQVSLRCPAVFDEEAICSADLKHWFCCKCKGIIWYGLETKMFYCEKCKKQCKPVEATYRCDEDSHDLNFVKYPEEYMWAGIYNLGNPKFLNILILGETGVGKSTWINAFANQLYFDSLDEASKQSPVVAIPSKFTITKHGVITNVSIGDPDDNELYKVGASNTQGCKSYPFRLKDYMVNLIDTPAIGDTRGLKQDDKNMDNILSHISYYQEIHAILILLKPNDARLGIFFRHCIQQLLTHLHKSASDNIVFVFTNTRSTLYTPGETLRPLRKLLEENKMNIKAVSQNMFCFDSETFRTLACMLNKIELSPAWLKQAEKSWKYAVDETKRLLHHIKSLTPHKVRDTTTLNEARRVIVELSRPLQEFATNIKENITKLENQKREAASLGNKINDYYSKLAFEGITLEQQQLVKLRLDEKKSKMEKAEKNKKELEELIVELKEEDIEIQEIVAGFAVFFKTFAILPFNDAMGEYIEKEIELEEEQFEGNTKKTLVKELRLYKEQYEKQRKILEEALDKTKDTDQGRSKAASSITALKDRAFKLKHFGNDVMKVYNKIDKSKKKKFPASSTIESLLHQL